MNCNVRRPFSKNYIKGVLSNSTLNLLWALLENLRYNICLFRHDKDWTSPIFDKLPKRSKNFLIKYICCCGMTGTEPKTSSSIRKKTREHSPHPSMASPPTSMYVKALRLGADSPALARVSLTSSRRYALKSGTWMSVCAKRTWDDAEKQETG